MNIALVSEHASPLATLGGVDAGGQNVHVAALGGALARAGNRVTVYTRRDDVSAPRQVVMQPGLSVEHVDAGPPITIAKDALLPWMDDFAEQLLRAWRVDPPDVVHSHFWMSGKAGLAAARALAIPLVHTYHALGSEKRRHHGSADPSPATRIGEERAIAHGANRIIATASAEAFELRRMGANPGAIKIIPCGVDLERFSPRGAREFERSARMRILTMSRLVERKGIGDVIEALAEIPAAELIVAGGAADDPATAREARRLRELAQRHHVADRVRFHGRVGRDAVARLMRSADIVACTPWYEPFGLVALEAMACGVPVVVSAVGGQIDTVIDGVSGVHVPPRDPHALAAVLRSLATDPRRRHALATAGLQRARARYSWTRIAAETLDVYRHVAARDDRLDGLGQGVS